MELHQILVVKIYNICPLLIAVETIFTNMVFVDIVCFKAELFSWYSNFLTSNHPLYTLSFVRKILYNVAECNRL